MSLLCAVLKPLVRRKVKSGNAGMNTYEEFVERARHVQERVKVELPRVKGYEFREESILGCRVLIGKKSGSKPGRAVMYVPGGGMIRWQLPFRNSYKRYMGDYGFELWIPLYPLYPDHNIMDADLMIIETHKKMLEHYTADKIAWVGFSAGGLLILSAGRMILHEKRKVEMPRMMVPGSCGNLRFTEETYEKMKEIESLDILNSAKMVHDDFPNFYDHKKDIPEYVWGNAQTDDYTGFPEVHLFEAEEEVWAAEVPAYEKAFKRCGISYQIHMGKGMFHAWPVFTFVKEGRDGETEVLELLDRI